MVKKIRLITRITDVENSFVRLGDKSIVVVQVELSLSPPVTHQLLARRKDDAEVIVTIHQPYRVPRRLQVGPHLEKQNISVVNSFIQFLWLINSSKYYRISKIN